MWPELATRDLPDAADLIPEDEERRLALIVEHAYYRALRDVHLIVTDSLGLDPLTFRLPDEAARDWAARHAAARVTQIAETTRQAVRDLIADALEDGRSTYEIIQELERLYLDTWKSRPEMIATTEITEAQRAAAIDRYRATGLVDRVRISDATRGTRHTDTCLARNGTTVPLDEAPGLDHPNCSLLLIPVLREGVA